MRLRIVCPCGDLQARQTRVAPTGMQRDTKLIWAASTLCFFGFMRVGELTALSASNYDPGVHSCMSDIAVDNLCSPSILNISITQSKTEPFRKGVCLAIGQTGTPLCPVAQIHTVFLRLHESRGTDCTIGIKL